MRTAFLILIFCFSTALAQLPGDFNCNGDVNGVDLLPYSHELSRVLDPVDTASCFWRNGDYNQDGIFFTLADYGQLRWYILGKSPDGFVPQSGGLDTIRIGNGRGNPGGDVYLPIYLSNIDSMADFQIRINFHSRYLKAPEMVFAPGYDYFNLENDTSLFICGNSNDTIPPGRYWIGNIRFSLPENTPSGTSVNINLETGEYFPSGFITLSYPTYFISPVLIPGQIWVNPSSTDDPPLPEKLSMNIYPNPFNSQAKIEFTLEKESDVRIEILDLLGRVSDTPINGRYTAGSYSAIWNASGKSSGVYFCRMTILDDTIIQKIVLLK
jgi:hypothetical protein